MNPALPETPGELRSVSDVERKEWCAVGPNGRYVLRRVIFCLCLASTTAQFGFTAAHAAPSGARETIDQVFAESFPRDGAPPAAASQAPAPSTSGGQSVSPPSAAELALPKPKADKPAPSKPAVRLGAGSVADHVARVTAEAKAPDAPEEEPEEEQAPRAERSTAQDGAGARQVTSTAYCLTGTMASGRRVYQGAAAMNGTPLGSRYQVLDGPRAGETFVIEDRIGYGSSFDIAYPGDCRGAYNYGRRRISIRPV